MPGGLSGGEAVVPVSRTNVADDDAIALEPAVRLVLGFAVLGEASQFSHTDF